MNVDMSVAPEIALLAQPIPYRAGPSGARPTIGALAGELSALASHPERWWGFVRLDQCRSEKIDLDLPGFWLAVLSPGDDGIDCDCDLMTVVAGDVLEESVADGGGVITELRPGRMRVHGQGQVHQLRASGDGFAVSLHAGRHDKG
jgi:hypothetical protein